MLPVELISFKAIPTERKVQLVWHTASETNNDFFTLERSLDGQNWEHLVKINGAGNTSSLSSYKWPDENPYSGISYYRLSQQDFNGTKEVFPIESVTIKSSDLVFSPNPAQTIISIQGINKEAYFNITNLLGQNVTNHTPLIFSSDERIQLNIEQLKPGIYYFHTNEKSYPFIIK